MELINVINKYKNNILNLGIIILAFIFAINIYNRQSRKIVLLNETKNIETEKNEVLGEISQFEKNIISYRDFINKKDVFSVINTLGNITKESSVKIISIKPEREKDYPLYTTYPFNLTVEADNYHTVGKFISKLESHPDFYIVDELSIRPQAKTAQAQEEGFFDKLILDFKLSTVLLKDKD